MSPSYDNAYKRDGNEPNTIKTVQAAEIQLTMI